MVLVIEMGGRRRGIGADCARGTSHSALHDTEGSSGPGLGRTYTTGIRKKPHLLHALLRRRTTINAVPISELPSLTYKCGQLRLAGLLLVLQYRG